jgi:hypothetical protein
MLGYNIGINPYPIRYISVKYLKYTAFTLPGHLGELAACLN